MVGTTRFILADSDDNPFTYTVAVSEAGTISGKLTGGPC